MNAEQTPLRFSQRRIPCPSCGSARALAPFADKPGGFCHNEQRVVVPDDSASLMPAVQRMKERERKLAAVYHYTDENGARLYSVDRYSLERLDGSGVWKPGKTFVQHPHGSDGARAGGMRGVRRVLYNLPAVVQAIAHGWPVVLCEGERDADTYNEIFEATGFDAVATTSAQGAKGWTKYAAGYVESLRGARLILDGDCDASGVAYMRSIIVSVRGVVAELRATAEARAALAGAYGDGPKDITDRIAGGLTPDAAVERLQQAHALIPDATPPDVMPTGRTERAPGASGKTANVVCAADVEPEEIHWLWPGRIARGKITILDGDPGMGKSTIMLDLAARLSTGGAFPDGALVGEPLRSLIVSAEDGLADTIVPRLIAAGANTELIHYLDTIEVGTNPVRIFQLENDGDILEETIRKYDVAFVFVDPLASFVGAKTDMNRDNAVRGALSAYKLIAERTGAAFVGLRHINKTDSGKAIYRGLGSIAFTALARTVMIVADEPNGDGERKVLAVSKSNIAKAPPALIYSLANDPGTQAARVEWHGTGSYTADALVAQAGAPANDRRTEAANLLRALLDGGPVPSAEVLSEFQQAGFSKRQFDAAKTTLGVKPIKVGFGKGATWTLQLPNQTTDQRITHDTKESHSADCDSLDSSVILSETVMDAAVEDPIVEEFTL